MERKADTGLCCELEETGLSEAVRGGRWLASMRVDFCSESSLCCTQTLAWKAAVGVLFRVEGGAGAGFPRGH